ncbi:Retrovirus-related Pol polyprotein from transposon TNT 1-94 [Dendrobium catenatum]|uniref:Retrovirus-related Pol polyprotein from transposon TNT 1-94 n=1 Tax=Dendrobium catenatum TaxID=906689 RepID=A0A2I0VN38_9ASPA|nr:Retrovirus-related Pol polyprotein from transposon TNT 1-94 [Dendrobium catenatum]
MATSITSPPSDQTETATSNCSDTSLNLKFVLTNLKNFVQNSLSTENYSVWRSQIVKICRANGFDLFLDPNAPIPDKTILTSAGISVKNPAYAKWLLIDQNLSAAICATISPPLLPYVLNLDSTSSIWTTLETRFQSTNRSRVIQLKNELHHISLKNSTMLQYLIEIKSIVDKISAAGSNIDPEDVILYILNGLPNSYQSFKTSIRTMLTPLTLDQLYPLLISEEIHLATDAARLTTEADPQHALFANRGRSRRSRGRGYQSENSARNPQNSSPIVCQICLKKGHNASECWHRLNTQYQPRTTKQSNTALLANSHSAHNEWFLDSGASSHMTKSLDNLSIATPYNGSDSITIGDGSSVSIANQGNGLLPTPSRKINLSNILHSPFLNYNLLSISKLTKDNNLAIIFDPSGFRFKDLKTQQIILQGPCREGLYPIQHSANLASNRALHSTTSSIPPWHDWLGHPNQNIIRSIALKNSHLKIDLHKFSCHICNTSKQHKLVFEHSVNKTSSVLDLIHSDVWGPAPMVSNSGFLYYVIFIDDYSRFTWLFPMKQKSEVFNIFVSFKAQVENLTSHKIKRLRTDGGGEYLNKSFNHFLKLHGITHQTSCPYTPEQNGVAERKHRHIVETTRTLLHKASVPYKYWPDTVITSTYLINRMPSPNTHNMSPFELFHKSKPNYDHLRIFGCACFPLISSSLRHKLQPTAKSCIFIGYSDAQKGYKCLDPLNNRIIISRHVTFDEGSFPFAMPQVTHTNKAELISLLLLTPASIGLANQAQNQIIQTTEPSGDIHRPSSTSTLSQSTTISPQIHPPATTTSANTSIHPMVTRQRTGSLKPQSRLNLIHSHMPSMSTADPTSFTEASKNPEWRKAMASEFLALQQQGTWSLVAAPINTSVIGCKWTYRTKLHADGSVARYKARLVAQRNHQEYGLDYYETFSPVAKLPTIRILLTIALYRDWPVHQLDVANAFLHGTLQETIYMKQPKGFEDSTHPTHVCHLHKAIYGLKQAPRQWYNTFTSHLVSMGFQHSVSDPSLLTFIYQSSKIYMLIYVDDILITGDNTELIHNIIHQLNQQFTMKHLGEVHSFPGIEISRKPEQFFLSQKLYAQTILDSVQLGGCNPLANPTCTKLPPKFIAEGLLSDPTTYRRVTGSLQYLTLTRPDISYSVNLLSQHMHQPLDQHIYLLKRLLRYIKGTIEYGIPIIKSNLCLSSFSDADWAGDPVSRKSTSGYCSFLGNTLISWTVKKQTTIARSSTESEYRSLAALTADVIWLRRILNDFGIPQDQPTDIHCDNTSAIALANNPVFHARTKHIEIDHRFVRDHIQQKMIRLIPVSTIDQIADIFTKSLSTPRFQQLRFKLRVIPRPNSLTGDISNTNSNTK